MVIKTPSGWHFTEPVETTRDMPGRAIRRSSFDLDSAADQVKKEILDHLDRRLKLIEIKTKPEEQRDYNLHARITRLEAEVRNLKRELARR
jgi:hypothetical protein